MLTVNNTTRPAPSYPLLINEMKLKNFPKFLPHLRLKVSRSNSPVPMVEVAYLLSGQVLIGPLSNDIFAGWHERLRHYKFYPTHLPSLLGPCGSGLTCFSLLCQVESLVLRLSFTKINIRIGKLCMKTVCWWDYGRQRKTKAHFNNSPIIRVLSGRPTVASRKTRVSNFRTHVKNKK